MKQFDEQMCAPLNLDTTRSHENPDAHRDMDGFDVNEELARLRRAVKEVETAAPGENLELYKFIVEAFSNIDESLRREGDLPRPWWAAAGNTEYPES
jgi:hypothetical protein